VRDVGEVGGLQLGLVRDRDHHVRVAHVDAEARARDRQLLGAHQRLAAVEAPAAEVDLEPGEVALDVAHSRPGADREGVAVRELGETGLQQVADVHADAVAAHLGDRAVRVVVVHEPLGAVVLRERLGALRQVRRADGADHTVAADPEVPVADRRDLLRSERQATVGVGIEHEVVAGPLTLGEVERRHRPSLSAARRITCDAAQGGRGEPRVVVVEPVDAGVAP